MAEHPAPARGRVALSGLWFGFLAGPLGWTVQTLVDSAVASHGCFPRLSPLSTPTVGGLRGIVFAVSLAAIALCIAGAAVSWRDWTRTREEHHRGSGKASEHAQPTALLETGEGRTRFMALSGVLVSLTFLIVTIGHAASIFLVSPCQGG
ncbi:MAG TPA: hypothetical protein VFK26_07490 [Gemmatimonadaceae bacterium]|jgi:hypothetical protein|nr:hypothetical protein [Gemmatimonadaceae bacterium]